MADCPNCGQQVDESAALCPNCGFDLHSQQADEVRHAREEGLIHPGRVGEHTEEFSGRDPAHPGLARPHDADEADDLEIPDAGL